MGDPLSSTASILAFVNLAAQSSGYLYTFFQSFSKASEDLRHHANTLEALQSSFLSILALRHEKLDPTIFAPGFQSRVQECMLDLQALEGLIKSTQMRCERNSVGSIWARLRWASVDQKARVKRYLERIERHRDTFSLDLMLVNIRLNLRSNTISACPELCSYLQKLPHGGANAAPDPAFSNVEPSPYSEQISIRSSVFSTLESEALHLHTWFGPNTIQHPQYQSPTSSNLSKATNGYGITVAAAMYGLLSFRIELAIYLIKAWRGKGVRYSLNWSLSIPRTMTWNELQVESTSSGDVDALQRMFSKGDATPFEMLPDGSTLLHVAASRNHVDVVRLLLQQGAKVNAMNDFGETPLHLAITLAKDYNVSRLLLESSADLQNRNTDGKTPLHTFFSPVVQQILHCHSQHLDLAIPDHNGITLLHYLAWSSKTPSDDFRDYHHRTRVSLQATTADGLSPLHLAAQRGNMAIIEYIIQTATATFKNLAALGDCTGKSALHYAVESKRAPEVITSLLSQGVDIRAKDRSRRSALHQAARFGRLPTVETLVAALLPDMLDELHVADVWGMTPAMVAAHHKKDAVAAFLEQRTGPKAAVPLPFMPCDPAAEEVHIKPALVKTAKRPDNGNLSTKEDLKCRTKPQNLERPRDVQARARFLLLLWVCAGVVIGTLYFIIRWSP